MRSGGGDDGRFCGPAAPVSDERISNKDQAPGQQCAVDSKEPLARQLRKVQPLVAYAARNPEEDLSLAALAGRARLSAYHLHRLFAAAVGETPKQLTSRLRLGRAAA